MTNGNASDSSAGSNKRARFDDANIAATSAGTNFPTGTKLPPSPMKTPKSMPFEAGEAVYTRHIATLHTDMQPLLTPHAYAVFQAFATYYRSKESWQKEKDNATFIPKTCNISLTLQPRKIVEQSQGFKGLAR